MKATISLDASDLLKIARLVHDTPHEYNAMYSVKYIDKNTHITLIIEVHEDICFGYIVEQVIAKPSFQNKLLCVPNEVAQQIENVL